MMARPIMWLRKRPDLHSRTNQQLLYIDEELDRRQQHRQHCSRKNNRYLQRHGFDSSAKRKLLPG